ncbi:MAG TPA: hypothetical protein VK717_00720 [Opitutaceae bacterium]|jgi:hypothetical protein|nr:hypothetical protein [Opitutaceae bacterium]
MTTKPVFAVEVDLARNLLRSRYSGHVTATAMQAAVEKGRELLPGMKPGFALLADWGQVEAMDFDCAPQIAELMDLCGKQGVGLIVRVLPDPARDIGLNILSIVHYRGKVRTVTCETAEEAEQALK